MTGSETMTGSELYESWRKLGAVVLGRHEFTKSGLTFSAVLPSDRLMEAARELLSAGYFLEDLSSMQVKEGFLVTYHFDSFRAPGRVALRVLAGEDGHVPSIASVYQGAEWHERESTDFLGLKFIGNPNLVPLLLPPEFPDCPPLLREEKSRAALADLNLFGEAEVLDPAWANIVSPPRAKKEEGEA